VTASLGTNVLVGQDEEKLRSELANILSGASKKGTVPPRWDVMPASVSLTFWPNNSLQNLFAEVLNG